MTKDQWEHNPYHNFLDCYVEGFDAPFDAIRIIRWLDNEKNVLEEEYLPYIDGDEVEMEIDSKLLKQVQQFVRKSDLQTATI